MERLALDVKTPVMQYHGMRYLDVPVLSPLGLRMIRDRLSNHLFCWLSQHCPRLAEAWALRR
jgi:hypothetical protein